MVTITVKNGKATLIAKNGKAINLAEVKRNGKNTRFNKFAIKNGKAICTVYALPKFNGKVNLNEIGVSANAHKFDSIENKNIIVSRTYLAKQGKAMLVK
jgi:hypothetical protein